ncbi:MAG: TonB-dependent receptor [Porticoccaceae bacterium]
MLMVANAADVIAQQSSQQGLQGIDEIIVTAQRRAERLQDVPVSVSIVTGETLDKQAIYSLADLSARQPNLKIVGGSSADQLHIRGTGSGFNGGFEQSVATFVDGVYRSRAWSSRIAMFDTERVEVLKGPQTLFFGANAIAGALSITSRRPGDVPEGNISALYSPNDGERKLEGAVTQPLSDNFSVRLAGRYYGMDGYSDNDRDGDGPNLDNQQGRVSFVWTPSDSVEIYARYDKGRMRDKGLMNYEIVGCPPRQGSPLQPGAGPLPPHGLCAASLNQFGDIEDDLNGRSDGGFSGRFFLDLDETLVSARISLPGADLTLSTAYFGQESETIADTLPYPGLSPIGTRSWLPVNAGETFEQLSQEIRLESTTDGKLQYMVGAYFEKGNLDTDTYIGIHYAPLWQFSGGYYTQPTPVTQNYKLHQDTLTYSAFGSLSYDLSEKITLSGGLRYTRVEKEVERETLLGTSDPLYPTEGNFVPAPEAVQTVLAQVSGMNRAPFENPKRNDGEWMPSVKIQYTFSFDAMMYASYTKGFKAGGFSYAGNDRFEPEYVDAYEVGFKASWLDRRLITNLALFRSEYEDLQEAQNIQVGGGVAILQIANAAESRAQGVEFEATALLSDNWRLTTNVAWLESEYISYENATCNPLQQAVVPVGCVQDLSGEMRPYAADWSGSVGLDYSVPVGDTMQFSAQALLYFTSGFYMQASQGDHVWQPGYGKTDLRLALGSLDERWELALIGKNIFDKQTASYLNYTASSFGTASAIVDRPSSVAVQVNWNF